MEWSHRLERLLLQHSASWILHAFDWLCWVRMNITGSANYVAAHLP